MGFPNEEPSVSVPCSEQDPVRRKGDSRHPFRVFLDVVQDFPGSEVVYLDALAGSANRHLRLICGNVGGQDGVVLIAEGQNPSSGPCVPSCDFPHFASSSSTCQQEQAVTTEVQRLNKAFGVGEQSKDLECVGVVENNLFLA